MPFPSLSLSADVRALTDRFLETPIGGTITYADMTAALGSSIEARRYLIQRALHVASRETGAIFASMRAVGYKRLPAEDAPLLGSHARQRIRNTSRRAAQAITHAVQVANDISDGARTRAYAEVSALALIQHVSTDRAAKAIPDSEKPQPVAVTLRGMMARLGAVEPGKAA